MAVLFIGLFVAVGIAYPTVQAAYDERRTAIQDRDERALDLRNTAIEFKNVSYDGTELTVNISNNGSTTLSVQRSDLLVNGVLQGQRDLDSVSVDGNTDRKLWQPGEVLSIVVTPNEKPVRVKFVTEQGVAITTEVT